NPDIMCNQEVKFRLFLDAALEDGADLIATGHYARTDDGRLLTARNVDKDQTYFLYRVTEEALEKSLFPIGEFKTKDEVRAIAKKLGLATASKKDSQGICFVGKVGIKEFLQQYVTTEPGAIIDQTGKELGQHEGAIFYTIGQRHGLTIGGGLPYYVIGKDMTNNEVYVTSDIDDQGLWKNRLTLVDVHWINGPPDASVEYQVRSRYRAPLVPGTLDMAPGTPYVADTTLHIALSEQIRAATPGQSAVIYSGDQVVGGGIISGKS